MKLLNLSGAGINKPMFTKDQLDRYARHIILPGVGAAGQARLLASKVLVIGAGGLGSPILLYLSAAGLGQLGIVDDDVVDLSNLQRQVLHSSKTLGLSKTESARRALEALNPEVKLTLYPERLSAQNARSIIRGYDLVIDGSDNFPTRYLVNDACILENKPLLYGAISQFEGQLTLLNASPESPCYRCLFPEPPAAGTVLNCAEAGVFGVLPGIMGSLMATEALKYLLELGDSLAGKLLHYDALHHDLRRVRVRRKPECAGCGEGSSKLTLSVSEAFCSTYESPE